MAVPTLTEVLDAREARARRAQELLRRHAGAALIVFTVNMPGEDKNTPGALRAFQAGCAAIDGMLRELRLAPLLDEQRGAAAGRERFLLLSADALALKRAACLLEEGVLYGRLWDIDVLRPDGTHIDRAEAGFSERGCIVCGKPGRGCASRRLHPLDTILNCVNGLIALIPAEDEHGDR